MNPNGRKVLNLVGHKYHKFTVQYRVFPKDPNPCQIYWMCLCECGTQKIVSTANLRHKTSPTRSCGCLSKEWGIRKRTHGLSRSTEYHCWLSMKTRCCNPKSSGYKRYGGRGIKICNRWIDSFEKFLADMGPRPSPEHTVERRDNNGDYCPENCYWATHKEQQYNKRVTIRRMAFGKEMTTLDMHKISGIPIHVIIGRLRIGWSAEDAATRPVRKGKPRHRH